MHRIYAEDLDDFGEKLKVGDPFVFVTQNLSLDTRNSPYACSPSGAKVKVYVLNVLGFERNGPTKTPDLSWAAGTAHSG